MTDAYARMRYLLPLDDALWRWNDDGETLVWRTGKTIAFADEINAVLHRLAPGGLPPFGAVALLLAACREYECPWDFLPQDTSSINQEMYSVFEHLYRYQSRLDNEWFITLNNGLGKINALPADFRTGVETKAALAEAVFEHVPNKCTPATAKDIVDDAAAAIARGMLASTKPMIHVQHAVASALESLATGLARFDADAWQLRRKSGLEQLPQPAAIDLPASVLARRLLVELQQDTELYGLARIARDMLAAVHLPRQICDRDELPVGGISDIANRGSLDRLLISELAHDELTLAVRVALGDALFLRREEPPRSPSSDRCILLDAGIRLWGWPRVVATAIGLAMVAVTNPGVAVRAFRAEGKSLAPVDLTTRRGLSKHLEALLPSPHPADALAPFANEVRQAGTAADAIVVTAEEAFRDADFKAHLTDVTDGAFFLATVARDGTYRLRDVSGRNAKLLREVRLDLQQLMQPPQTGRQPLLVTDGSRPLPIIFTRTPFPLRLPHAIDMRLSTHHPACGALTVSADNRLCHWSTPGVGARQLTDAIPAGAVIWMGLLQSDSRWKAALLTSYRPKGPMKLLTIDLDTHERVEKDIQTVEETPLGASELDGYVFVVYKKRVTVLNPDTGEVGHSLRLASQGLLSWHGGRFFCSVAGTRYALAFDGCKLQLEAVSFGQSGVDPVKVLTLFDRQGYDGPWYVTRDGGVGSTVSRQKICHDRSHGRQVVSVIVSRDGHRLKLTHDDPLYRNSVEFVDLRDQSRSRPSGEHWRARPGGDHWRALEPEMGRCIQVKTVRRRFREIFFDRDEGLVLVSRRGLQPTIRSDQTGRSLILRPHQGLLRRDCVSRPFEPIDGPAGVGYHLRAASWSDGSRAILDSRGLLHLQSSEPSLPEMTLVLPERGLVAGWDSHNRWTGPRYFTGFNEPTANGRDFEKNIRAFFTRLT